MSFDTKLNFSFTPAQKLKFWAQKVLPLVYDDSISYLEVLYKTQYYLNELAENMDAANDHIKETAAAFNALVDYVNNYYDNLDLSDAIRENIEQEIASGVFDDLINKFLEQVDVTQLNIPTYYNDDMNVSLPTTDNMVRFIPNEFRQGNNPLGGSSQATAVVSIAPIDVSNNVGREIYICADKSFVPSEGFGVYNVSLVFYTEDNTRLDTEIRCWTGTQHISAPIPENAYNMYIVLSTGGTGKLLSPTMLNELYPKIYVGYSPITSVSAIYHYRAIETEVSDSVDLITTDMSAWGHFTGNLYRVIPENWRQGIDPLRPLSRGTGGVYDDRSIDVHNHVGDTMYIAAVKTPEFRTLRVEFYDEQKSNRIGNIAINGSVGYGSGIIPNGAYWANIILTVGGTGLTMLLDDFIRVHYICYVGYSNIYNNMNIYPYNVEINEDTDLYKAAYVAESTHAYISNANHMSSERIAVKAGDVVNIKAFATDPNVALLTFYTDFTPESGTTVCVGVDRYTPVYRTFRVENDGFVVWCTRNDCVGKSYFAINEYFDGIPPYWYEYLHNKYDEIIAARGNVNKAIEYIYITDIHWLRNAQHSPAIINWLVKRLGTPICVFGGDIIELHTNSKQSAIEQIHNWRDLLDTSPVMIALGNHDNNESTQPDSTAILTDREVYNAMYKKSELDIHQDGVLTAYYDDPVNKVRHLAFDYWGSEEHENAINKALAIVDDTPADYAIIVYCHAIWTYSNDYTETIWNSLGESVVNSFVAKKQDGANIIAINVGHIHKEYDGFYTNLLCVASNTDNYNESVIFGGSDMTLGTTTEQSFEYVIIDQENKIMDRIIIGASESRKFNYETGAKIE